MNWSTTPPAMRAIEDDQGTVVGYERSEDYLVEYRGTFQIAQYSRYQDLATGEWEPPAWYEAWTGDEMIQGYVKKWIPLSQLTALIK